MKQFRRKPKDLRFVLNEDKVSQSKPSPKKDRLTCLKGHGFSPAAQAEE
jgi:hypothetical protein